MRQLQRLTHFLAAGLLLLGLSATMFAQKAPEDQNQQTRMTNQATITGCLNKDASGTYTLTDEKTGEKTIVAGTADLDTITEHADIRFEILKGVKKTTDFLLDFILNRPKEHKGDWHVFFRGKTEAEAIAYRQKLRDWYDTMESQRARIAEIYNAKTTARC